MVNHIKIIQSAGCGDTTVEMFLVHYITVPNSSGNFREGFRTIHANSERHATDIFLTLHDGVVIISVKNNAALRKIQK